MKLVLAKLSVGCRVHRVEIPSRGQRSKGKPRVILVAERCPDTLRRIRPRWDRICRNLLATRALIIEECPDRLPDRVRAAEVQANQGTIVEVECFPPARVRTSPWGKVVILATIRAGDPAIVAGECNRNRRLTDPRNLDLRNNRKTAAVL